jgi:hypothetical protein
MALAGPASAAASAAGPQWATVNVCDGATSVGVRASMPGDDHAGRMLVRVGVQWIDPKDNTWKPVEGVPNSPWLSAGSSRQSAAQAGWTFQFDKPPAGVEFQLRGVAELQWHRGGSMVRSAGLVTSGALVGVAEGVPLGTSQATCTLR